MRSVVLFFLYEEDDTSTDPKEVIHGSTHTISFIGGNDALSQPDTARSGRSLPVIVGRISASLNELYEKRRRQIERIIAG